MDTALIACWLSGVSIVVTLFVGIIAWGHKAENQAVSLKIDNVKLSLDLVRSEFREALARAEIGFFDRVNGKYTRTDLHSRLEERVANIEQRIEEVEN